MVNPIVLGAGGFFGKEGVVRGVAPKFKQVYEKYETQASISLLIRIAKGKFFSRPFGLAQKDQKAKTPANFRPQTSRTLPPSVDRRAASLPDTLRYRDRLSPP
ncbi:hypothetical protein [Algoriphagus sp.]|uniref:hypothetical protein n=1 Tax=Algoriphagus sp. TaxID=1872435 RepID=UPI003F729ABB